jgi:hypothetical protein
MRGVLQNRGLRLLLVAVAFTGTGVAQADALNDTFSLSLGTFAVNTNTTVRHMPWKNFGIGAGWNEFVTNLNVSGPACNGNMRWKYGGLRLFLRASF